MHFAAIEKNRNSEIRRGKKFFAPTLFFATNEIIAEKQYQPYN